MGTPDKVSVRKGGETEESEPDFVDVGLIQTWKKKKDSTSGKQEANGVEAKRPDALVVNVQRSQTARSSMKSPLSRLRNGESGIRRISFDLHEPQVSIQPSKDESLRHIFENSRWSTSSSEPSTPNKLLDEPDEKKREDGKVTSLRSQDYNELFIITDETKNTREFPSDNVKASQQSIALQKSKSLRPNAQRTQSIEVAVVKRRHSAGFLSRPEAQGSALRDSAIDLISDEENSEAYTAVSLAGTLKRNAQPVQSDGMKKKYIIIGIVCGALAIAVIVVLAVLLARKE